MAEPEPEFVDWRQRAACRDHPDPDLWHPTSRQDPCTEAKRICDRCDVAEQCMRSAIRLGIPPDVVVGGYRTSNRDERRALAERVGIQSRSAVGRKRPSSACQRCGEQFESRGADKVLCVPCRTVRVSAEPVRDHLAELNAAGLTYSEISVLADVPKGTIATLMSGMAGVRQTHCETAASILAIPIPDDKQVSRRRRRGTDWVLVAPLREHITRLNAAGLTYGEVSERTGVPESSICSFMAEQIRHTRRTTAEAILAVPVPEVVRV